MRDDNKKIVILLTSHPGYKLASQSGSKTPKKQRNAWTLVEEKKFLILFCFDSIELKGFSIGNFADEKYKGGI